MIPKKRIVVGVVAIIIGFGVASVLFRSLTAQNTGSGPSLPVEKEVKKETVPQLPTAQTQTQPQLQIQSQGPASTQVSATSLSSEPPQIAPASMPSRQRKPMPTLELSGIFCDRDGSRGYAIINQRIVKEGDEISGAKVMRITTHRVEMEYDGQVFNLRVK